MHTIYELVEFPDGFKDDRFESTKMILAFHDRLIKYAKDGMVLEEKDVGVFIRDLCKVKAAVDKDLFYFAKNIKVPVHISSGKFTRSLEYWSFLDRMERLVVDGYRFGKSHD